MPPPGTAPLKVSRLDAHLGDWLRFVANQASHAFSRKRAACGATVAKPVMLRHLMPAGEAR